MTWQIKNVLDHLEAANYGSGLIGADLNPLSTGFPIRDKACVGTGGMGLANWWYVVLGGASNVGKTQLLWHLLRQAWEQEMNPGLITMEVPMTGVQRSIYSRVTDFGYNDLLPSSWIEDGADKTTNLAEQVRLYAGDYRALMVAEHDGAPSLDQIIDMCYAMKESGCGVIGLDHLQLIKGQGEIADLATEVSEELRRFAHREKILVVALSQLNRVASRERDVPPISQSLLGGTAMESNANQVVLIDHSKVVRDMERSHLMRTRLILDKNREGPNRVAFNVEANFATGVWREGMPDEEHLWIPER
jgi:replicative DNA helicase